MISQDYHNHDYSLEDIRRYLSGEMPASEAHDLEKAALDDPLLADAIEGLEQHPEQWNKAELDSHLRDLEGRLTARLHSGKRRSALVAMRWWRMAAAVIIVALGGWMAYLAWWSPRMNSNLAQTATKEQPAPQAVVIAADSPVLAGDQKPKPDSISVGRAEQEKSDPAELPASRHEDKIEPSVAKIEEASSAASEADKKAEETADSLKYLSLRNNRVASTLPEKAAPKAASRPKKQAEEPEWQVVGNQSKQALQKQDSLITRRDEFGFIKGKSDPLAGKKMHVLQGQVVDERNLPVANALVLTNNRRQAVLTNEKGYFNVPSVDSTLYADISLSGYQPARVIMKNGSSGNRYILRSDSNNVLENTGINIDEAMAQAMSKSMTLTRDAEPVNGWPAYYEYLRQNRISLPDEERGKVMLRFSVNRNGRLGNIEVVESLNSEQDEEAIRLVQKGPAWKCLTTRKNARVTLVIPF